MVGTAAPDGRAAKVLLVGEADHPVLRRTVHRERRAARALGRVVRARTVLVRLLRMLADVRQLLRMPLMRPHDVLALQLDAAQLLVEQPELVFDAAALDGAAARVEEVVLAAVADLTLELQQLLISVSFGSVLLQTAFGRRAVVALTGGLSPLTQTPRQFLLDLSEDVLL